MKTIISIDSHLKARCSSSWATHSTKDLEFGGYKTIRKQLIKQKLIKNRKTKTINLFNNEVNLLIEKSIYLEKTSQIFENFN